jgi:hypothetical protein
MIGAIGDATAGKNIHHCDVDYLSRLACRPGVVG